MGAYILKSTGSFGTDVSALYAASDDKIKILLIENGDRRDVLGSLVECPAFLGKCHTIPFIKSSLISSTLKLGNFCPHYSIGRIFQNLMALMA